MKKLFTMTLLSLLLAGCSFAGSAQDFIQREVLTSDAIKQLALNHSQLNQDNVVFDTVELDDDKENYNVVLSDDEKQVVYVIEAASGKILNFETKPTEQKVVVEPEASKESTKDLKNDSFKTSRNTSSKTRLSQDEALNIALKHAGESRNNVKVKEIDLDRDDGRLVYEIEFYSSNKEYDYEIDAHTGKILEMDFDIEGFDIPKSNGDIGMTKAKEIALSKVPGANHNHFTDIEKDYDDGRIEYEFEIIYNGYEYDIEIDGASGKITDFEKESIYD